MIKLGSRSNFRPSGRNLTFSYPCMQCLVSVLSIVNKFPKITIGTLPLLSSKTGGAIEILRDDA